MTVRSNPTECSGPKAWCTIVRFLFIVALIVLFFLLGQSMVRHRFFRGGWVNQHGTIQP